MTVIILTTKLEFSIWVFKKVPKDVPYIVLPFSNFLAVPLCSLHVALSLQLYCYSDGTWLWSFDIKLLILYNFYCFIHLPLFFIKFFHPFKSLFSFTSVSNLTCLIMTILGMAGKGVSFGNRQWALSAVSNQTFSKIVFEWMSNFHLAVFMVSFNFFFICTGDFSRVFQHYQACQVDNNEIFVTYNTKYFADLWKRWFPNVHFPCEINRRQRHWICESSNCSWICKCLLKDRS